jgi:hypothetical protein
MARASGVNGTDVRTTDRPARRVDPGSDADRPTGTSYSATRFGIGFVVGMLAAGAVGAATGTLGASVLFGFALGLLVGVVWMELG